MGVIGSEKSHVLVLCYGSFVLTVTKIRVAKNKGLNNYQLLDE